MEQNKSHQVICFGEVLWDILPSGEVPGGAPMNVAYHLHKLHRNPAVITRIGRDDKGHEIETLFAGKGVCTDYFQVDDEHETGKVYARLVAENEMAYEIVQPVAWDFIEWNERYASLLAEARYFVFGSLAARSERSRATLMQLLEAAGQCVFDINLRAPHYSRNTVEDLLRRTSLLKLNESELGLLSEWYGLAGDDQERIQRLADRFRLSTAVVTLGGDGALLLADGRVYRHGGFRMKVQDTVGSGDAFLAGLLSQLMEDAAPEEALRFANGLGALIAGKRGACPDYDLSEVRQLLDEDNVNG